MIHEHYRMIDWSDWNDWRGNRFSVKTSGRQDNRPIVPNPDKYLTFHFSNILSNGINEMFQKTIMFSQFSHNNWILKIFVKAIPKNT